MISKVKVTYSTLYFTAKLKVQLGAICWHSLFHLCKYFCIFIPSIDTEHSTNKTYWRETSLSLCNIGSFLLASNLSQAKYKNQIPGILQVEFISLEKDSDILSFTLYFPLIMPSNNLSLVP